MADRIPKKDRSRVMAAIKGKDTKPEIVVRSVLHKLGYRFSVHRKDLPGNPDIVLTKYNAAILVHGCFWHQHSSKRCKLARLPKSRLEYWRPKLEGNRQRDERAQRALRAKGWRTLTIWECQLRDTDALIQRLVAFLGDGIEGLRG
jgi:DNA mismatch endonuclease (patch repair protein)